MADADIKCHSGMVTDFAATLMGVTDNPCLEMRVLKASRNKDNWIVPSDQYGKTWGGWYDDPEAVFGDARSLQGVSAYVTINPVNPAKMSASPNKLKVLDRGSGTTDELITSLEWLFIDIDPERPSGISSTDGELASAIATRDRILSEVGGLSDSSIWGKSGNGTWILARLPGYPNDDEHRALVERTIHLIAGKFSDDKVKIDTSTKNPSRIMCLPGTMKCKGEHDVKRGRPWRMATIDSPRERTEAHGKTLERFDLASWLGGQGSTYIVAVPSHSPSGAAQRDGGMSDGKTIKRARAYLEKLAPAVAGQNGHGQTFDAAGALILGFDLSQSDALLLLKEYNQRCDPPWTDSELEHKLQEATEKGGERGYLLKGRDDWTTALSATQGVEGVGANLEFERGQEADSYRLARLFLSQNYMSPDGVPTLWLLKGEYYTWRDGRYHVTDKQELRSKIAKFCEGEFTRIGQLALAARSTSGDEKKPKKINVTGPIVSNVVLALDL
jgi:putative DNA primase/helicase